MKKILLLAIIATAFSLHTFAQTVGQYGSDSLGNCYQFGADQQWHQIQKKFIAVNALGDTLGFFCTRSEAESIVNASNARIKQYLAQNKTVQTSGNGNPVINVTNSQKSNNQSSSEYEDYGYGGYTCNQCGQGFCDNHHRCGAYWFNNEYYCEGQGMYCTYYRDRGYVPNLMGQGTWCTWRRNSNGRGWGWFRSYEQNYNNYQYTSQYGGYVPQPQGGCGRQQNNGCNGGRVAGWEYGVRISK